MKYEHGFSWDYARDDLFEAINKAEWEILNTFRKLEQKTRNWCSHPDGFPLISRWHAEYFARRLAALECHIRQLIEQFTVRPKPRVMRVVRKRNKVIVNRKTGEVRKG